MSKTTKLKICIAEKQVGERERKMDGGWWNRCFFQPNYIIYYLYLFNASIFILFSTRNKLSTSCTLFYIFSYLKDALNGQPQKKEKKTFPSFSFLLFYFICAFVSNMNSCYFISFIFLILVWYENINLFPPFISDGWRKKGKEKWSPRD